MVATVDDYNKKPRRPARQSKSDVKIGKAIKITRSPSGKPKRKVRK